MRRLILCSIAALALAASGLCADTVTPVDSTPTTSSPSGTTTAPKSDPNVVVLTSEASWWHDKALDRQISLSLKDSDLKAAVAALANASGMNVVAPSAKAGQKVTVQIQDAPLRDVLRTLSSLFHMRWHKMGNVYSLQPERGGKFLPVSAFRRQATGGVPGLKITRGSRGYRRWPLGVRRPKPVRVRPTRVRRTR